MRAPARTAPALASLPTLPTIGLFGRGRLATAIDEMASSLGAAPRWLVGRDGSPGAPVEVAIDASAACAVESHLDWALETETDLVIATTGWAPGGGLKSLEARVGERIAVVLAPNGSLSVALVERLARCLGAFARAWYADDADGFVHDHHHAAKVDAPSGTARRLAAAWSEGAGRAPAVTALRAGHEVGEHVVGLDAPGERLEIVHRARSRATFAHGLLHAVRWARGRRGVFTMVDAARDAFRGTPLDPLFDESEHPTPDPESPHVPNP